MRTAPRLTPHAAGRRFSVVAFALAVGASVGCRAALAADEAPGRTVESVRAWVIERNPELKVFSLEAAAAAERPQPAGALPDPMLRIDLDGIDRKRPQIGPSQVGQTSYEIRQRFPFWGKRELARDAARAQADASAGMRDARALDVLAEAERAYVRYWHSGRALEVLDRILALIGDVESLARARYGNGLVPMQDALRAQLERTAMQRERIDLGAMRGEAVANLNATLGRSPNATLAEPQATPELPVAHSFETLLSGIQAAHPELRAALAEAAAAGKERALTYRNRYPDLTLGFAPIQMGDRVDSWRLMFEVEVPLQQTTRRSQESQARLMEQAALARTEAVRTQLLGMAGERWAQWQAARQQLELVESTLLPQSEASYRAAIAGYRVGSLDFTTLLEAVRQWRAAQLARFDTTRDLLERAAALRALDRSNAP